MKEYTDEQYKDASQIAYITFLKKQDKYLDSIEEGDHTVEELVRSRFDVEEARRKWEAKNPGKKLDSSNSIKELKELVQYADNSEISKNDKKTLANISDDSYQWKFVFCQDTNSINGFYGCVLETPSDNPSEKGDLMIAFRGSEGLRNYNQLIPDWDKSDFGLLLGETQQQHQVEEFADLVSEEVLPNYEGKQIDVTGHSLGGNLASFFTIHTCKEHREIFDQIHKCYNLDGPNYKNEEVEFYGKYAGEAAQKIVHYKASLIGNLFSILSYNGISEEVRFVHVKEMEEFPLLLPFFRHETANWDFDKNGNLIQDDGPDLVSQIGSGLSQLVDFFNVEFIGYGISSFVFQWMLGPSEDGKTTVTPLGIGILITLAGSLLKSPLAPSIITGIFMLGVIYYIDNKGYFDKLEDFLQGLYAEMKTCIGISKPYLDIIYNRFIDYIKNNANSFAANINFGTSSATNNPVIQLDTDKLRYCASRLEKVNQRLSNLDNRVKALYYNVGLADILNILNADLNISYNNTLKRCSNYLYETANDFEQVERNVESAF